MADLAIITPPTSTLLLDPTEACRRLRPNERKGDPVVDPELAAVTRVVEEISSAIAGRLDFEPWFQVLEESFTFEETGGWNGSRTDHLPLEGRPYISIVSCGVPGETPLVLGTDFAIRKTGRRGGDAYLFRPDGWSLSSPPWPGGLAYGLVCRYRCGWWLPGMTGTRPIDVPILPADLALAAWLTFRWRYLGDQLNPQIAEMDKGRVRLKLVNKDPTSIPDEADDILKTYRPLVLG